MIMCCIGILSFYQDYPKMEFCNKRFEVSKEKMMRLPRLTWMTISKVGRDDPRRVTHAIKVGFSLTLVSCLYLLEPLYKCVGDNAIWAVMTVVVVLEFTAGATLCKGLNRGFGTFLAGSLALLCEFLASEYKMYKAIFIGAAVFIIGMISTYVRFIPKIKKNYDYGIVIFLLTFNLITVSSYRVENVLKIAHERFYTIIIGCVVCLLMSLLIFPNWSGEALHNSTVSKLEGLAKSIEVCVGQYFSEEDRDANMDDDSSEDPIYKGYKAVLDSKSTDETLALHASWEPRHSRHCYRFPGQQYVKLGAVLRHFSYTIVALHGCLQTEIQTPKSIRALFKDPCIRLAGEVSTALIELAESIKSHRQCSPVLISDHLHEALHDLNRALKSQPRLFLGPASLEANNTNILTLSAHQKPENHISSAKIDSSAPHDLKSKSKRASDQALRESERKVLRHALSKIAITSLEFSEALPFAAFASLLVETVARLDLVIEEVEELGRIARFKEYKNTCDEVIVDVEKSSATMEINGGNVERNLPSATMAD